MNETQEREGRIGEYMYMGDVVTWRGSFGDAVPRKATVTSIALTPGPREKHGVNVPAVPWSLKCWAVVSLDNGHWAYGEQLEPAT